ncbi:MAG: MFS transporter [Dysgonamonadaceae bacterium]|jgi:MFS family permease|nr:MFS transporter [Dysgonamonadaceae bacterium]MDD4379065.1 MFS transporter [Dysgonamonadaceae bacterium]
MNKKNEWRKNREISSQKTGALRFIVLMGVVSLFGDIVYEGARGVIGPYLALLGASASVVGLVGGLGEFIGYALRLFSGFMADRTKAYWLFTFIGYGLLVSIPLLSFAQSWQIAALLILLERAGKAFRSPARDTILSYATKEVGRGFGFGLHEALDQIGAIVGPLIFSAILFAGGNYRLGFSVLWIPAMMVPIVLCIARNRLPHPEKLEIAHESGSKNNTLFSKTFVLYSLFTFFAVAGFANFPLIAYHLKMKTIVGDAQIPALFALAMGVDALTALIIGKTYDRMGLKILIIVPLLSFFIPLLAFSDMLVGVIIGTILWGIVLGIHETIMRAAVADLTDINRRGSAYGIFNTLYGLSWLLGGTLMGMLYEQSVYTLMLLAALFEVVSIPLFLMLAKSLKSR